MTTKASVHHIRVRYAETDTMGVAHHSAYVAWLEEARIEWLRQRGVSYRDLEKSGVFMPVTNVTIDYRRPFRFDDDIEFVTTVAVDGRCSLIFSSELRLLGSSNRHALGKVTVTAVDPASRPMRLPAELLADLGLVPQ